MGQRRPAGVFHCNNNRHYLNDMLSFKTSNLLILQVDKDAPRARDRIQSVSPDALASYEDNSVCEEVWLYVRLGTPMFMVMYK